MSNEPGHIRALLTALFVTFLWSSSWVLIRWGLDDEGLTPITFASLRYGLASLILVAWVASRADARSRLRSLDRSTVGRIAVLGVIFYAVTQGAQFVAIDNQPAATTSLVLSLTPLLVAMVGGWSLSERSSSRQIVGTILVIAGAWAYFSGDLGATTAGMVAAAIGLMANVTGSVLGRQVNRDAATPPIVVTALSMVIGSAILIVAGVAFEGVGTVSPRAWLIIAWLAVVNTAWAFTLWNLSLQRLSALESSAVNNTMLIQIAILGLIFLDEPIGIAEGIGIVLVTIGILLTQTVVRRPARRRIADRPPV